MSVSTSAGEAKTRICPECNFDMPIAWTHCPHCGLPQFFPNVDIAESESEKQKLDERYKEAITDLDSRSCSKIGREFETACGASIAVFNCSLERLNRQIASETEIFAPYRDLERLRLRLGPPEEYDFERLRPQAEIELLGNEKHIGQIHYASLSIDGTGVTSYGECTVRLKESMVAHRTSCFEGNTAIQFSEKHSFAEILRSGWSDRAILCTAVYGEAITSSTVEADFQPILINVGATKSADRFVELHVFGPMTGKTFESVHLDLAKKVETAMVDAICDKLSHIRVEVTRK